MRAAIVIATPEQVKPYLPANYEVVGEFTVPGRGYNETRTVIAGTDSAGWTLDGYVIPRLGSGLYRADEVPLAAWAEAVLALTLVRSEREQLRAEEAVA